MQIRCSDCSFEFEVAEGVVRVLRSRSGTVACRRCHRPVPLDGKRSRIPPPISPPPTMGPDEVASLQEPTPSPVPATRPTSDRPPDPALHPAILATRPALRPPPLPELPSEWLVEEPDDERSAESARLTPALGVLTSDVLASELRALASEALASRKDDEVQLAKPAGSPNPNMVTIPATVSTTSLFGEDTSLPPRRSSRARTVVVAATLLGAAASAFVIHRGATHLPDVVAFATAKRNTPAAPLELAPPLGLASHERSELNASAPPSAPTLQDDPPEGLAASAPLTTESPIESSTSPSAEASAAAVATLSAIKKPTSVTVPKSGVADRADSDLPAKPTASRSSASAEQQPATDLSNKSDGARPELAAALAAAARDEPPNPVAEAVRQAMVQAALGAQQCHVEGIPAAGAQVRVTFATTGEVKSASLESPFDVSVAQCILTKFRALRIPPFTGNDVTAKKTVKFE